MNYGNNFGGGYNNNFGGGNFGNNNFGGGGGFNSPESGQIQQLLLQCTQSGAYPTGNQNMQVFLQIFSILKSESQSFTIQKADYMTSSGNKYFTISYCGTVGSSYKGRNYDIFTKVLLPPGFPNKAPIMSVLNIDHSTFSVNQKFIRNILPDETFEVKLDSSMNYPANRNFSAMLNEYKSIISINFPFFKSRNPTNPPPKPAFYDDNFGSNNMNNQGWGNNNMNNQGWGNNNLNPGAGGFGNNNMNSGWGNNTNNMNSGWGGNNMNSGWGGNNQGSNFGMGQNTNANPGSSYGGLEPQYRTQIREILNGLNASVKHDIQESQNQFNELLRIRGEGKLLEGQIDQNMKNFDSQIGKNEYLTVKLAEYHSKHENLTLDGDKSVIDKLVAKDHTSRKLTDLLSELKSNDEVNGFFIDQYIDGNINLSFNDVLGVLEKKFKSEFSMKCQMRDMLTS